jgi:hypothetical protein
MNGSPLDNDQILDRIQGWLDKGASLEEIAKQIGYDFGVTTSEGSVRRAIKRHDLTRANIDIESSSLTIKDDEAVVSSDVTKEQLGDAETLIRERGLDPNEWIIERMKINEWDSPTGETLKQLTVHLKRRIALKFVSPAVHIPPFTPSAAKNTLPSNPDGVFQLAVIVGDEQEPYSDPILKDLFLQWLTVNKPARGIHLGDLMDFPTISRHKDNPEWAATVQECINTGYQTLRSYCEASHSTEWEFLVGNHDERLRTELLLRAERMYGIKPASIDGTEQEDALSIKRLLHLDALRVKFIDPKGGYAHAHTKLSPLLGVRHGWLTGANAAMSTLDRLGHSVIVGHTHHQRIHYKTIYGIDGQPQVLQAVEAGTMCKPEGGLGYVINPNWQQGFATATVWTDGSFNIELATYSNGVLRWRDQRYEA